MNRERLLLVADAIENRSVPGLGFNMEAYVSTEKQDLSGHGCGTTACIAGWAVTLARPRSRLLRRPISDARAAVDLWYKCVNVGFSAQVWLDLTDSEADDLFFREGFTDEEALTTDAQAVRTLRYAAKHGVIDWEAAQREGAREHVFEGMLGEGTAAYDAMTPDQRRSVAEEVE